MIEGETVGSEGPAVPDGPRVGLASYDLRDPEATFRLIEPFRPRPAPRGPGLATWIVLVLLAWSLNLAALAAAGILVTDVGPYDPVAYVAWAAVFALVNAATPVAARLVRRARGVLLTAVVLLAVDIVLVWFMTLVARPFHSPELVALAKAGALMWLVNLPLAVVFARLRGPAAPGQPA